MLSYNECGSPSNTIRADLMGSDTCSGAGITATGAAPVLALCRQLLAVGSILMPRWLSIEPLPWPCVCDP
jgi:hypothetical protein